MVRFSNLIITSSYYYTSAEFSGKHGRRETSSKTILDSYVYGANKYSDPLTSTLLSLHKELFKHAMYENGIMKNYKKLGSYKGMANIDNIDDIYFNGITKPTYSYDEFGRKLDPPTGWVLGFVIPNSSVIRGEISPLMIVDIVLIFKGWTTDEGFRFGSRKLVKSLTVKKNLSPLFKPGKEVIGRPWEESYKTAQNEEH